MRRRLVQSTLAVAVVAVALLGVPLAVAGVIGQRVSAQQGVERAAARIGQVVEMRLERGEQIPEQLLEQRVPDGAYGYLSVQNGPVYQVGERPPRPITGRFSSSTTTVLIQESGEDLRAAQAQTVALVVVVAVVAVGAAVMLGLFQARRLAEPLVDLAARARRLGAGDTRPSFPRYGVPEVDEVADALDSSAGRVASMLASERQFASDASHQLRTPLTALSMRLEEILNADDPDTVREEAGVALGQVERLAGVVDHLLASARQSRSATAVPVAVDEVLDQQRAEWSPAFAAAGRRLQVTGARRLRALATPGGLAQVLSTLLENSLHHGAGTTVVNARGTGTSVVVEVSDAGAGVPPELGSRIFERAVSGRAGTGLGLALARDLAEADGGRLELVQQRPPVFALFLAALPPGVEPAPRRRPQRAGSGSGRTAGKTHRR